MKSQGLNEGLDDLQTTSNYKFSATPVDDLGAAEYTLVSLVTDVSGSVASFRDQIEKMLKTVLQSCKKSPRADNLMLRLITFDTHVKEQHGFKLLNTIKEDDYTGIVKIGGSTALFDATAQAIEASATLGKQLQSQDFLVNAINFIITDGDNNCPPSTSHGVAKAVMEAKQKEFLESITTVLIGIDNNNDPALVRYLQTFMADAQLDQFVNIGAATAGKLAKLANFVSQSVSSTSQAIGSGGPSQPLTF